jgi:hypothetical protein
MNKKQNRTLEQIFKQPTPPNISWKDIESLFEAVGCEISEGSGSRVRIKYENQRAVFHRPHPKPITDKGAVSSVKKFLKNIGVKPC